MIENISLLNNVKSSKLHLSPFPHLVIENALDENTYNNLSNKFPLQYFKDNNLNHQNNTRKDIFYDQLQNIKDIESDWKKFIEYHSSIYFYREILSVFDDVILKIYKNNFKNKNILYNCKTKNNFSTSVNTPVTKMSSVRSAHLDNLNKLFTGLYYMKYDDDYSLGGDLELYSWKKNISKVDKRILSQNEINLSSINYEKTIKYKSNTFLIFLNSLDSLHGVTPRSKTNFYRRMCVFTSKLPFSLDQPNLIERIQLKFNSHLAN